MPLDRERHDRSAFGCGEVSLDRYLHQQATQDIRRQLCAVYVLAERSSGRIGGYYTLSASSILPAQLPALTTKRLPRYDSYPATLIGRLAVDDAFQGMRFGSWLVNDALSRSVQISKRLGVHAMVVDALNDRAAAFYRRFGFSAFVEDERRLFITIADVRSLFPTPRPGAETP